MTSNINMRGVREGVEDSVKQARDLGRKAMLATLGVAGVGFDRGEAIGDGSGAHPGAHPEGVGGGQGVPAR